jgi:hypothetical protein
MGGIKKNKNKTHTHTQQPQRQRPELTTRQTTLKDISNLNLKHLKHLDLKHLDLNFNLNHKPWRTLPGEAGRSGRFLHTVPPESAGTCTQKTPPYSHAAVVELELERVACCEIVLEIALLGEL